MDFQIVPLPGLTISSSQHSFLANLDFLQTGTTAFPHYFQLSIIIIHTWRWQYIASDELLRTYMRHSWPCLRTTEMSTMQWCASPHIWRLMVQAINFKWLQAVNAGRRFYCSWPVFCITERFYFSTAGLCTKYYNIFLKFITMSVSSEDRSCLSPASSGGSSNCGPMKLKRRWIQMNSVDEDLSSEHTAIDLSSFKCSIFDLSLFKSVVIDSELKRLVSLVHFFRSFCCLGSSSIFSLHWRSR